MPIRLTPKKCLALTLKSVSPWSYIWYISTLHIHPLMRPLKKLMDLELWLLFLMPSKIIHTLHLFRQVKVKQYPSKKSFNFKSLKDFFCEFLLGVFLFLFRKFIFQINFTLKISQYQIKTACTFIRHKYNNSLTNSS